MEDGEQFEKRMEMEYSSDSGILHMNIDKDEETFDADVNELTLDPMFIDLKSMKIDTKGIVVHFISSVLCETNGEEFTTKMNGVTIDGKTPDNFFNDNPMIKKQMFGNKWEESVDRQRQRMEKRRKRMINSIR